MKRSKTSRGWVGPCLLALSLPLAIGCRHDISIGAKTFPESGILGESAAAMARAQGLKVRLRKLNGTKLCWSALLAGDIDAYPEYTGTIRQEIFAQDQPSDERLPELLASHGVKMTAPLGFNNTYALGVLPELAERLKLQDMADLAAQPQLRYGFSNEFMSRVDGWPGLKSAYQLRGEPRGMEHALAYRALESGDIDVVDVYSTDANVRRLKLVLLTDRRKFFPRYDALMLYRADLEQRAPQFVEQLKSLSGRINDQRMTELNERVAFQGDTEAMAAASFLRQDLQLSIEAARSPWWAKIAQRTLEHAWLVGVSLTAGIVVSIPLGVLAAKKPWLGRFIVSGAEIVQTIPGLALLIFLGLGLRRLGLSVIGELPVILALFLYSLLPIVRNTMAGIANIPSPLRESAVALGLSPWARLWWIELPLASPLILAGVKTTAVMNVGFAALGALIGAGGYGQPIMTGLTLNDEGMMLEGAVPAALMALVVKWGFEYAERWVVPRGLRMRGSS